MQTFCSQDKTQTNDFVDVQKEISKSLKRIKRPTNAFLVFSNEWRPKLRLQWPNARNNEISARLGYEWLHLPPMIKEDYFSRARLVAAEHKKQYPDYVYTPKITKGRRRKSSKLILPRVEKRYSKSENQSVLMIEEQRSKALTEYETLKEAYQCLTAYKSHSQKREKSVKRQKLDTSRQDCYNVQGTLKQRKTNQDQCSCNGHRILKQSIPNPKQYRCSGHQTLKQSIPNEDQYFCNGNRTLKQSKPDTSTTSDYFTYILKKQHKFKRSDLLQSYQHKIVEDKKKFTTTQQCSQNTNHYDEAVSMTNKHENFIEQKSPLYGKTGNFITADRLTKSANFPSPIKETLPYTPTTFQTPVNWASLTNYYPGSQYTYPTKINQGVQVTDQQYVLVPFMINKAHQHGWPAYDIPSSSPIMTESKRSLQLSRIQQSKSDKSYFITDMKSCNFQPSGLSSSTDSSTETCKIPHVTSDVDIMKYQPQYQRKKSRYTSDIITSSKSAESVAESSSLCSTMSHYGHSTSSDSAAKAESMKLPVTIVLPTSDTPGSLGLPDSSLSHGFANY